MKWRFVTPRALGVWQPWSFGTRIERSSSGMPFHRSRKAEWVNPMSGLAQIGTTGKRRTAVGFDSLWFDASGLPSGPARELGTVLAEWECRDRPFSRLLSRRTKLTRYRE